MVLQDSLPEDLERLVNLSQVDWTGKLIGRSEFAFKPIPTVEIGSEIYLKIEKWIKILENSLISAKSREIFMELARLRLHFSTVQMTSFESKLLIKDYVADLHDFPIDIISKACNDYRYNCESTFFPSIAKLLKLIKPHMQLRQVKLSRLKKIIGESDKKMTDLL